MLQEAASRAESIRLSQLIGFRDPETCIDTSLLVPVTVGVEAQRMASFTASFDVTYGHWFQIRLYQRPR